MTFSSVDGAPTTVLRLQVVTSQSQLFPGVQVAPRQQPTQLADTLFASYGELARSIVPDLSGASLLDEQLTVRGETGKPHADAAAEWLRSLGWAGKLRRTPTATPRGPTESLAAFPLETTDGKLLGVFCVQAPLPVEPARAAQSAAQRLKPLLDSLHRELVAAQSKRSREQTLTERTEELEWLFKVTQRVHGSSDEQQVVEELLTAATERLNSAFGALCIPDKRLMIEHTRDDPTAQPLREAFVQTRQHLLAWAQRRRRALVVNNAGRSGQTFSACKILCVPITLSTGRAIGMLAFFRPAQSRDYASREIFLARHLGRQAATLVEAQFDLMTGLYTRSALEQHYSRIAGHIPKGPCCAIYVDIDRMHVVNELHGFELGNELIVRVADLLGPPLLPADAFAGRLSGDRFAVVLPSLDGRAAVETVTRLVDAASRISIGPTPGSIEPSVSCGIADIVDMPQGLARALAAAEIACKLAKDRGRKRVEVYACEDSSMMRRHGDIAAVGQLRSALKSDRLVLYAQPIVPLQRMNRHAGYEILMRLRNPDGTLVAPGPLINAAQRYQLLPSIDRWVVQSALSLLAPYRSMLASREISVSINISGQSIGDEAFIQQLLENLRAAELPAGSIVIEITEQAAVKNLAQASAVIRRLNGAGCRFALDDFGTGANSLTYLKNLPVNHVKIDGSFVRDILTDRSSQATVRGIVELAKGFGIATVAEYVENEAIAGYIRKMGVDYGQGYAFGKPEPLAELLASVSNDESRRLRRLFLEL